YTQAFGMIKWYDQDLHAKYCSTQDAYLGLGFD
ncbi:MAG: GNAT family N-acetyltransferase, partial [Clostridiales bacterium]|nr:GNAT family N-acetyltransferase [Clostridiales bacterium]